MQGTVARKTAPRSRGAHGHLTALPALPPAPEPRRPGRRTFFWSVAGAIAIVAAVALALAVAGRPARPPAEPRYRTATVTEGSISGTLPVVGQLDFESTVRVGSALAGQVIEARAGVGDKVVRGQVLARLDNLEQRAVLDAADAQLTMAELQLTRVKARLSESLQSSGVWRDDLPLDELLDGAAGEAQLDVLAAAAQIQKQDAAFGLARGLLSRRVIRAPVGGVVVGRSVERGETVIASPPGPALFVIDARPGRLVLRAEIDQAYVARVQAGPARIIVPAFPARSFVGEVVGTSSVGGASAALLRTERRPSYEVRVAVDNADGTLAPGLSATAELPMSSPATALRVPAVALDRSPERPDADRSGGSERAVVWTVAGAASPALVPVETGVRDGRYVEIRGRGVGAGQTIALPAAAP